jgi:hypothetical protein
MLSIDVTGPQTLFWRLQYAHCKNREGRRSRKVQSENELVDVTGIELVTPCLQSKRQFNLSRCFGCAYHYSSPS